MSGSDDILVSTFDVSIFIVLESLLISNLKRRVVKRFDFLNLGRGVYNIVLL